MLTYFGYFRLLKLILPVSFYFKKIVFYIGIYLINNVVLVPGIQQSDSVIHIHVSILFQSLSPFRLLQSIEQSSLLYRDTCWISILNTTVCTCQSQTPNVSLPSTFSLLVTIVSFSKSVSLFLFYK